MTHHWDGYGWIIRSLFQYEGLLVVTLFPKHSSLWNHNFQNTFLFPSQLLVLGVQSDELETLSRQKTSDEQRLLMAQSRHDQDFSSSRVEASKQMAAARDIALRQIPDGRDGNHSLPKYVCLAPRHSTSSNPSKDTSCFLLSESGRRKERTREQMQETLRWGALREQCQDSLEY